MIIGFTLGEVAGFEKEAIAFIEKVCLLPDKSIARNIILTAPNVNVYSKVVTVEELEGLPFVALAIEVDEETEFAVIACTEGATEITLQGELFKLKPTEYIIVDRIRAVEAITYESLGVVRILPKRP